ncbi:MAG: ParB/RepB/Spo0J family partition protein, partial [Patescibacteria group bacterium]
MDTTQEIYTDQIKLPANNMREHIDRDEIFELAQDIKKNGLINPIMVRPLPSGYELVAGQRRYLAHQVAGILKIKCVIRALSDDEALAIMTSENLVRVDVNPVDEAKHILRFYTQQNSDIKAVAKLLGRGEKWVHDRLAIGAMPDYLQDYLATKQIKLGVALILNEISDEATRRMWVFQAARDGVSIDMANYWLQDYKRQLLPGGNLAPSADGSDVLKPPTAIMFRCAVDGREYDVRMSKAIIIYEGNLELFKMFISEFQKS